MRRAIRRGFTAARQRRASFVGAASALSAALLLAGCVFQSTYNSMAE